MDDVNKLGEDETDIVLMDDLCQVFEAISGAILNRNCQPIILGLGSWAGLASIVAEGGPSVNIFVVLFTPTHKGTVAASWD
jgi:hypothetical protein